MRAVVKGVRVDGQDQVRFNMGRTMVLSRKGRSLKQEISHANTILSMALAKTTINHIAVFENLPAWARAWSLA